MRLNHDIQFDESRLVVRLAFVLICVHILTLFV
jgi:hypothetical protein